MAISPGGTRTAADLEAASSATGLPVAHPPNPLVAPLAKELQGLKPEDRPTLTREYLAKKLPEWGKLKPEEQNQLVGEVVTKWGTPADEKVKQVAKAAMSSPEMALRTIPPLALQTGAMFAGEKIAGGPGERGASAAASVANDYYQRFLNYMYGETSQPMTLQGEENSALAGALAPGAPKAALGAVESVTGLRAARQTAEDAAAAARESNAKVIAEQAGKNKGTAAKALKTADEAKAKIQEQVEASRQRLAGAQRIIGKKLNAAREQTAEQVGTEKIQQMIGKTSKQLQRQEAAPAEQFASTRSAAMAPVFEGARAYHDEVGKMYEPYIGAHASEPITNEQLGQLHNTIANIRAGVAERGQVITNTDLNRVLGRIEDMDPTIHRDELLRKVGWSAKHLREATEAEKNSAIKLNLQDGLLKPEDVNGQGLTVGELWGMRSRAGKILASSKNPAERLAAHQIMDSITEMMPDIPDKVRQQYAAERSQFPSSLMGEVARARNPGEVGAAIFGSPTSPEPAQIALNLIKRAKTPEQMQGLRDSFADNWLAKPHSPDDLARYNPDVIKALFGSASDDVYKILGHEGTVSSASWQKLIQMSPKARDSFNAAYSDAIRSESITNLKQAVAEGERELKQMPGRYQQAAAALKAAKNDPEKAAIIAKALQDPQEAAVQALGKGGIVPNSRLERVAVTSLAFRTMYAAAGAGGGLLKHPELALGLGGLLGGRAAIRAALSNPAIARQYVKMLRLGASPENASAMGKFIGHLTAAATLQAVKEANIGIGQPGLNQPSEANQDQSGGKQQP